MTSGLALSAPMALAEILHANAIWFRQAVAYAVPYMLVMVVSYLKINIMSVDSKIRNVSLSCLRNLLFSMLNFAKSLLGVSIFFIGISLSHVSFENRLFLLGLDKYGKGDWRSISRNFVVTRTPTQVASHAQKYFIRLNSMNKDRRRSSIHDITSVGNGDISVPQGPITGQTNGSASGASSGKSTKPTPQPPAGPPPGVGMYGSTTIGQPIGGPLVSAVGTPVNLSAPPHMAYGVRAPVPGAVVPGAPMNMGPMTYPMPHTSAHR